MFKKLGIFIFVLAVFLNTLFWALVIPYNDAPDEYTHFEVARFIALNNRFPIFGQDENMGVSKYEKIGFRAYYNASYSSMPPLAYMVQALAIKIIPGMNEENYFLSARISSVFLSIIFVLLVIKLSAVLFSKPLTQTTFAIFTLFIPQVTFTFSYVNSDALALVLSTTVFYWLVCFWQEKIKITGKNSLLFGVILGLTALTRYNAFVYFPLALIVYLIKLKVVKNLKKRFKYLSIVILSFILPSGWWYLRNLILYRDPLGTRKFWETIHMLYPPENIGQNFYTLTYILFKTNWFWQNFKTFWAAFGWNYILLPENFYRFLLLISFLAITGLLKKSNQEQPFSKKSLFLCLLLVSFSFLLSLWQSFKFAFQAQGRYFFPVLVPISFMVTAGLFGLSQKRWQQTFIFLIISMGIMFLNIFSLFTLISVYY